jgi:hypothetical protein
LKIAKTIIAFIVGICLAFCVPSCAAKWGPWSTSGDITPAQNAQALAMVEIAKSVSGDHDKILYEGGTITFVTGPYAADGYCWVPVGYHVSGCSFPIVILLWTEHGFGPDMRTTALAHELCHEGLDTADEGAANACSNEVNAQTPALETYNVP